jgi:hypothetical protein
VNQIPKYWPLSDQRLHVRKLVFNQKDSALHVQCEISLLEGVFCCFVHRGILTSIEKLRTKRMDKNESGEVKF